MGATIPPLERLSASEQPDSPMMLDWQKQLAKEVKRIRDRDKFIEVGRYGAELRQQMDQVCLDSISLRPGTVLDLGDYE